MILDQYQRPLHDLRVSLIDRCNLRCGYCMPKEVFGDSYQFLPPSSLLSFEEITRLTKIFVANGVKKIRLTGGEPLMRGGVDDIVAMLASLRGVDDLAMTTNGLMLGHYAERLALAGLNRVTVSLDAVDENIYAAMSGTGAKVSRVIDGINAAKLHGLPVKVNAVIIRGVNDSQILPLVNLAISSGFTMRFIEYMDVGLTNRWERNDVLGGAEIHELIAKHFELEMIDPAIVGEVAKRYRIKGTDAEIGLITSITQPFCGNCSRARLSSEGKLFTCLFASAGTDLRTLMRDGISDVELENVIIRVWAQRDDRYSELRGSLVQHKAEMSYLGG